MKIKLFENFNKEDMLGIFKNAHASTSKNDLVLAKTRIGKDFSKEEYQECIDYLGVDESFLFYDKSNALYSFIYWKGPVYVQITAFNIKFLEMLRMKEMILQKEEQYKNMVEKKDYVHIFSRINKSIMFQYFLDVLNEIKENQLYDIFISMYTRAEYGFDLIPIDILKKIFKSRFLSKEWKKRLNELKKSKFYKLNSDGTITIYRGESSESRKDDGYSWTLDPETGKFFANRFSKGNIKSKNVKPEEIIDFINDRGESEVFYFSDKKILNERKIKLFEEFFLILENEDEPLGLAVLGAPGGGKGYAKKLITKITELVQISRASDPGIGMDLTVDILRGKILDLPATDQIELFFMAFYSIKELAEEDKAEFNKWFDDIKEVWKDKINSLTDLKIEVIDDDLIINGKKDDEALKEIKDLSEQDVKQIISKLDNYNDYKRIVRVYQQIKQKEAMGTKKDVIYDESGDEPEKIIKTMKNLHDKDYVTDVILVHHDEVSNNIMQNAYRMIVGADGGRDSCQAIVDSYRKIDNNLDKYKNKAEVSVTTTIKDLEQGAGEAPKELAAATSTDNKDRGDKPIDVFVRVKGYKPKEVYDRIVKELDDEQINVFKAILKYQISADHFNIPDDIKKSLSTLIGDISNKEALNILIEANSGKLKNTYIYKFGGVTDKMLSDARKNLE